ncbi:Pyridoxamine 5'-phosphate oxidase [Allokutzneria albata]|uniref:Pyridoxamine 5'-phosphate oxidase n=2 Tax=Allokutzneria albata TaxID=211114 RepID=A0A1G9SFY8_ALLAB|nr:Pyridoxamine 5'-phosphate oxidase [Allokutzneria albata]
MMLEARTTKPLDFHECLSLLQDAQWGRLVYTHQVLPCVLPTKFHMREGRIVLRIGEHSRLTTAADNTVVSFEADEFDPETGLGWWVTVTGHARVTDNDSDTTTLSAPAAPSPPGHEPANPAVVINTEIVAGYRGQLL